MQAEYNVTDLSNGFTVLTESTTFPGSIHMGKSSLSHLQQNEQLSRRVGMFICCLINNNKLMMAFMYYRIPNGRGYS